MKKILFILCCAFFLFSCEDVNDRFDDYDDLERPKEVKNYIYTFNPATDVKIIVDALNAKRTHSDSLIAKDFNTAKVFSENLMAADLAPYLFKAKYVGADVGSSVSFTFNFDSKRTQILSDLANATIYTLDSEDYQSVWGEDNSTSYLTPSNSPAEVLPEILRNQYSSPTENSIVNVEYMYADQEPSGTTVVLFSEDFEEYEVNDNIESEGWISFAETGTRTWQAKQYSGNKYAQMGNGSSGKNTSWIITPEIDLGATKGYNFSFDVTVGYWTASCLQILISTDGDAGNDPANATWVDITSKFIIPTEPSDKYGTMGKAGSMSLDDYSGKIRIAFKYNGDASADPIQTTTYQIDNISIGYNSDKTVPYSANSMYLYNNGEWKIYPDLVIPTGKDYAEMEVSVLYSDTSPNYLIPYLGSKYLYPQENKSYYVVYKTNNGYYADEYNYKNGAWVRNTFIEEVTEQYVYAQFENDKRWIFDPSFIIDLDKPDYQIVVDYVRDNITGEENPDILDYRGNAEFYYGFSAYYPNITYREIDRARDNTYPIEGTLAEKIAFMNQRTVEGLTVYLIAAYPDATPIINGVKQEAKFNDIQIYMDPTEGAPQRSYWTYTLQCVGDKEWKFVRRESQDGRVEEAE